MSFCEFEDDNGMTTFRCAKAATFLVIVSSDPAGNDPYELRYCAEHAAWYMDPAHLEGSGLEGLEGRFEATVTRIDPYVVSPDDDGTSSRAR